MPRDCDLGAGKPTPLNVLRASLVQQIRGATLRGEERLAIRRPRTGLQPGTLRALADMFTSKGFAFRFEREGAAWLVEVCW